MMPIGALMIEHRLIEKVIDLMEKVILRAELVKQIDSDII